MIYGRRISREALWQILQTNAVRIYIQSPQQRDHQQNLNCQRIFWILVLRVIYRISTAYQNRAGKYQVGTLTAVPSRIPEPHTVASRQIGYFRRRDSISERGVLCW